MALSQSIETKTTTKRSRYSSSLLSTTTNITISPKSSRPDSFQSKRFKTDQITSVVVDTWDTIIVIWVTITLIALENLKFEKHWFMLFTCSEKY